MKSDDDSVCSSYRVCAVFTCLATDVRSLEVKPPLIL